MIRTCDQCSTEYEAKTARSRYCSTPCRRRANYTGAARRRDKAAVEPVNVVQAVQQTLGDLGILSTPRGRSALVLAERLDAADTESGAGLAALARQLDALIGAALAESAGTKSDVIDELRARRRARVWAELRQQAAERKAARS